MKTLKERLNEDRSFFGELKKIVRAEAPRYVHGMNIDMTDLVEEVHMMVVQAILEGEVTQEGELVLNIKKIGREYLKQVSRTINNQDKENDEGGVYLFEEQVADPRLSIEEAIEYDTEEGIADEGVIAEAQINAQNRAFGKYKESSVLAVKAIKAFHESLEDSVTKELFIRRFILKDTQKEIATRLAVSAENKSERLVDVSVVVGFERGIVKKASQFLKISESRIANMLFWLSDLIWSYLPSEEKFEIKEAEKFNKIEAEFQSIPSDLPLDSNIEEKLSQIPKRKNYDTDFNVLEMLSSAEAKERCQAMISKMRATLEQYKQNYEILSLKDQELRVPWDHQLDIVETILNEAEKNLDDPSSQSLGVISPPSSGKSFAMALLARLAFEAGESTLTATSSNMILEAGEDSLAQSFEVLFPQDKIGLVNHGHKDFGRPVTLTTIQSLSRAKTLNQIVQASIPMMIQIDEGDLAQTSLRTQAVDAIKGALHYPIITYFSGTESVAGRDLGQMVDIVYRTKLVELIERKQAKKIKGYSVAVDIIVENKKLTTDRSNVDFAKLPAYEKEAMIQESLKIAALHPDEKGMIFCASVAQAEETARRLEAEMGEGAAVCMSGISHSEQKKAKTSYMSPHGKVKILTAQSVIGRGFSEKGITSFVVIARIMQSETSLLQSIMRGGRINSEIDTLSAYQFFPETIRSRRFRPALMNEVLLKQGLEPNSESYETPKTIAQAPGNDPRTYRFLGPDENLSPLNLKIRDINSEVEVLSQSEIRQIINLPSHGQVALGPTPKQQEILNYLKESGYYNEAEISETLDTEKVDWRNFIDKTRLDKDFQKNHPEIDCLNLMIDDPTGCNRALYHLETVQALLALEAELKLRQSGYKPRSEICELLGISSFQLDFLSSISHSFGLFINFSNENEFIDFYSVRSVKKSVSGELENLRLAGYREAKEFTPLLSESSLAELIKKFPTERIESQKPLFVNHPLPEHPKQKLYHEETIKEITRNSSENMELIWDSESELEADGFYAEEKIEQTLAQTPFYPSYGGREKFENILRPEAIRAEDKDTCSFHFPTYAEQHRNLCPEKPLDNDQRIRYLIRQGFESLKDVASRLKVLEIDLFYLLESQSNSVVEYLQNSCRVHSGYLFHGEVLEFFFEHCLQEKLAELQKKAERVKNLNVPKLESLDQIARKSPDDQLSEFAEAGYLDAAALREQLGITISKKTLRKLSDPFPPSQKRPYSLAHPKRKNQFLYDKDRLEKLIRFKRKEYQKLREQRYLPITEVAKNLDTSVNAVLRLVREDDQLSSVPILADNPLAGIEPRQPEFLYHQISIKKLHEIDIKAIEQRKKEADDLDLQLEILLQDGYAEEISALGIPPTHIKKVLAMSSETLTKPNPKRPGKNLYHKARIEAVLANIKKQEQAAYEELRKRGFKTRAEIMKLLNIDSSRVAEIITNQLTFGVNSLRDPRNFQGKKADLNCFKTVKNAYENQE